MTKENNAAKWVSNHGVKIYSPKSSGYWRVVWTEDGKTKDTTAKNEAEALSKASGIEMRLMTPNGRLSMLSVKDMYKAYVDPKEGGNTREEWGKKHTRNTCQIFNHTILKSIGDVRCADLKESHLRKLVMQEMTNSNRQHLISTLSAFINWGYRGGWILSDPTRLLAGLSYASKARRTESSTNKRIAKQAGESHLVVDPKAIPSHEDVDRLAKATVEVSGVWRYELMVNLAAYSGLRLGEILDLDITHVNAKSRVISVQHQLLDDAGNLSRELPKWGIQRSTVFPAVTPMGYRLQEQLERRIKELKKMREVPTLQDGSKRLLLFPDSNGRWLRGGSFSRGVRRPAQALAGWERDSSGGKFIWNFHSLRHVFCSYMINDLRRDPADVSIAAGHGSVTTTIQMYVGRVRGALDRLLGK